MPPRRGRSLESDTDSETSSTCTETSEFTTLSQLEEELGTTNALTTLHSIEIPSMAQIYEARRVIQTQSIICTTVDEECSELEKQLASIEARLYQTEQEITKQRSYLSRLRAIPQEVLSLVFMLVTEDGVDSPWMLAHVNRMWRRVALRTHKMWAGIQIESPDWCGSGCSRWSDGRERCGSAKQLQRALQRAHSTPLNVVIFTDLPHHSLAKKHFKAANLAILKMFSFLQSSKKSLQILHLQCKGKVTSMVEYDIPTFLDLSNLQTLEVGWLRSPTFIGALKTSEEFHTLKLVNPINLPEPSFLVNNTSIKTLVIEKDSWRAAMPNIQGLLRAACNVTKIEILGIRCRYWNPETRIAFPNLKHLTLQDTEEFWSIKAPNLTSLTITTATRLNVGDERYHFFPSLKDLTITCYTVKELLKFRAPALYSLHLRLLRNRDLTAEDFKTFIEECIPRDRLSPVHFHLFQTGVTVPALLDLLSGMPKLESVELENVPLKRSFFQAFKPRMTTVNVKSENTGRSHPKKIMVTPCPGIKKLKIDFRHCWASTRAKNTRALVPKVMKKRAEMDVLEKASIRYTTEEGWQDLL